MITGQTRKEIDKNNFKCINGNIIDAVLVD